MIHIIDDWFQDPRAEQDKAKAADYKDYTFEGVTWPHIGITEDQYSIDKTSKILGFELETSFPAYYRYYEKTDSQPMFVHSDVNEGEYTVLIFLNLINIVNGLAFYEHHTGVTSATKENVNEFFKDSNNIACWSEPVVVPASYNRAVMFTAADFHSRWPTNGWNIGTDTARLVKVLFLRKKVL